MASLIGSLLNVHSQVADSIKGIDQDIQKAEEESEAALRRADALRFAKLIIVLACRKLSSGRLKFPWRCSFAPHSSHRTSQVRATIQHDDSCEDYGYDYSDASPHARIDFGASVRNKCFEDSACTDTLRCAGLKVTKISDDSEYLQVSVDLISSARKRSIGEVVEVDMAMMSGSPAKKLAVGMNQSQDFP